MIRSFDLRDVPLIHRLRGQCVSLHAESALTSDPRLIRSALASMVVGKDSPIYVWKSKDNHESGFAQVFVREDGEQARIIAIGVETEANYAPNKQVETKKQAARYEQIWLAFIEQLIVELGQRGVHSIIAELPEQGEEISILRKAGFVIYTRQDIWVLHNATIKTSSCQLKPPTTQDDWDITLLYANTVPRLIQLVEPTPPQTESNWILREDDDLVSFVHRHDGTGGSWLRFFLHPNAHTNAEDVLNAVIQLKPPSLEQPLYCCVPRYQSWVQSSLQAVGFTHLFSQVVMVKHTVHRVQKKVPDLAQLLQTKSLVQTNPYMQKNK